MSRSVSVRDPLGVRLRELFGDMDDGTAWVLAVNAGISGTKTYFVLPDSTCSKLSGAAVATASGCGTNPASVYCQSPLARFVYSRLTISTTDTSFDIESVEACGLLLAGTSLLALESAGRV